MPLDPAYFRPSLIPELMVRDEWDAIQQYLLPADMGRLRLVSRAFSSAVTQKMLDQSAWTRIRQDEGEAREALHHFPTHPQARKLFDAGYMAASCVASVHYTLKDIESAALMQREYLISCQVPAFQRELRLARDGNFVIRGALSNGDMQIWFRIKKHDNKIDSLEISKEFTPVASSDYMTKISNGKEFLTSPMDWWLLKDKAEKLYIYNASTGEWMPEFFPGVTKESLADISCNGRFVAIVTKNDHENSIIRGYDRKEGAFYMHRATGDCNFCQISVANSGDIYVGTYQQGYSFDIKGQCTIHRYYNGINNLFRLSADGRFLVRSILPCVADGREGNLILEDRIQGREIMLPRTVAARLGACSSRPVGIAFSFLNVLVAVVYQDGVVQVFDLRKVADVEASLLVETSLPWMQAAHQQPAICFEGLDQIHILFPQCGRGYEGGLIKHTLMLGKREYESSGGII